MEMKSWVLSPFPQTAYEGIWGPKAHRDSEAAAQTQGSRRPPKETWAEVWRPRRSQVLCQHCTCPHDTLYQGPESLVEPRPWQSPSFHPHQSLCWPSLALFIHPCSPAKPILFQLSLREILTFTGGLGIKFVITFHNREHYKEKRYVRISKKRKYAQGLRWKCYQLSPWWGPVWSCNHNRKMPALQGCWRAMKTGLVFETTVKIVPPRAKQVFPEHLRNRSGKSLSPALKGKFLIFHAPGILPSSSGHRCSGYRCFKCHLAFLTSSLYVKGVG